MANWSYRPGGKPYTSKRTGKPGITLPVITFPGSHYMSGVTPPLAFNLVANLGAKAIAAAGEFGQALTLMASMNDGPGVAASEGLSALERDAKARKSA